MNDGFVKYHLGELAPDFTPVLHKFTEPDTGYPHDHPWAFHTHILRGGYIEQIYYVRSDGTWTSEIIKRFPGTSHWVNATHIHRVIELVTPECWTVIDPHPTNVQRKSRFWNFDNKIATSRAWDETEFR